MSPHARPAGVDIMAFFDCTAEDRDKILNMSDEEAQKAHFLSDELKEMVVFARAQTRFLEACKSGDVVTVRSMIAEGVVDVLHPREDTGACPLSEAAHGGSVAVMIELRKAGVDLDEPFELVNASVRGKGLATALFIAARQGQAELVSWLCTEGACDVHQRVKAGGTPMLIAACSPFAVKMMRPLLRAGANINVQADDGCTPLIAACIGGNVEAVDAILEMGADVNLAMPSGGIALHMALPDPSERQH